jgi:NADH-quinone oxidoreductase subunit L
VQRFEGGLAMAWPVAVLSVLALVGGFVQVPGAWSAVDDWLHPVSESIEEAGGGTAIFSGVAALLLALAGMALAWRFYARPSERPVALRRRYPRTARTLEHKAYFDEAYDVVFYRPSSSLASGLLRFVEEPVFLRSLGGFGSLVRDASGRVAAAQTGVVRSYVLAVAGGLAVLAIVFLLVS